MLVALRAANLPGVKKLLARLSARIERILNADSRYVCAACDERFPNATAGIEHVARCHPEYRGVVVYDPCPIKGFCARSGQLQDVSSVVR